MKNSEEKLKEWDYCFLHWARDNGHCDSASPSIETLMNVVATKGKIAAINMYREHTGVDLKTAWCQIESWMTDTKTSVGSRYYYMPGTNKLHRLDGPAIESSGAAQEWWIDGHFISFRGNGKFKEMAAKWICNAL